MADDSLDEFLDWDIGQNRTVTAWSSKVSSKGRVRKTYGRKGGSGFSSQRRTIRPPNQHNGFPSTYDEESEEESDEESEEESDVEPDD